MGVRDIEVEVHVQSSASGEGLSQKPLCHGTTEEVVSIRVWVVPHFSSQEHMSCLLLFSPPCHMLGGEGQLISSEGV